MGDCDETVETARAVAAEDRDQLKQRVDQAQGEANQATGDAKQQAEETADRARSRRQRLRPLMVYDAQLAVLNALDARGLCRRTGQDRRHVDQRPDAAS
jgi:hypothetical protein